MKPRWKIFDWAGNELTRWGAFETFEDAWDFIFGEMTDLLSLTEDCYQEFDVKIGD